METEKFPGQSNKISATIIAYNEEDLIGACIASLQGAADEIIVVDSFSEDNTEAICQELGVKFYQNKFEGHIQQKQYAIQLASYPFILSLDADESLSTELRKSIIKEKKHLNFNGYTMNRRNFYCGRAIKHTGWYPDRRIRLFHKDKAKWGGENPHDMVIMHKNERTRHLKGDLIHITINSLSELKEQTEKYARIAADFKFKNGKHKQFVGLKMIFNPISKFLSLFFIKRGFLDGSDGFRISYQEFIYTYRKYKYLAQLYRENKEG